MKNVAIYVRVSTEEQTEESQIEPCKDYCKQKNWDIVGIYADHAKSAYKNVKRPKYEEVLSLVKQRKIQHIVVLALDRWTRRGSGELKASVEYLNVYNVQLHSVRESWLEAINMPGGIGQVVKDFMLGMVGWIAEKESLDLADRVKTSKKWLKAKEEGRLGRKYLSDKTIKQIKEMLDEGKSYRNIRDSITYKAKYGKVKHPSIATISRISNHCYKNVIQKSTSKKAKNRCNNKDVFE